MNRKPSPFEMHQAAVKEHNETVIEGYERRIREMEARCAAMREALKIAAEGLRLNGVSGYAEAAEAELAASDAGRALLERLEIAERAAVRSEANRVGYRAGHGMSHV